MKVNLSYDELFYIEMAVDQAMYAVEHQYGMNNPAYQRYQLLSQKIYELRKSAENGMKNIQDSIFDIKDKDKGGVINPVYSEDMRGKQGITYTENISKEK